MEDRRKHDEEMSRQIQSAIAPLSALIYDLRNEVRIIRAENKEFRDIINGAKFLGLALKYFLIVGGAIGMLYTAFLVITHR